MLRINQTKYLQDLYGEYLKESRVSTRVHRQEPAQIDEFALWKLLQAENINDSRHVALPQIAFRLKGHNQATQLLYSVRK